MLLHIHSAHSGLTHAMHHRAEREMNSALGRLSDWVQQVIVRITDIGHRHGDSKRVTLQLSLAGGETVRIEQTDSSAYRALAQAAGRAKAVVNRRIKRRREHRR